MSKHPATTPQQTLSNCHTSTPTMPREAFSVYEVVPYCSVMPKVNKGQMRWWCNGRRDGAVEGGAVVVVRGIEAKN